MAIEAFYLGYVCSEDIMRSRVASFKLRGLGESLHRLPAQQNVG